MIKKTKAISKWLISAMLLSSVPFSQFSLTTALAESSVQTDYNLLSNSGFETDLTGWAGANATLARNTTENHSGVASAKVDRTTLYNGNIRQTGIAFEPGKSYYFSAWVKRTSNTGTIGIYINQGGNKWNNSSFPIMASATVGTTWTHIEGIKTFPTAATNPPSGYIYNSAVIFIQHTVDDSATKDATGNYPDFYADDIRAEPVTPVAVTINGSSSVAIPLEGNAALTYSYTKAVTNQMGTTEGIANESIIWSVDGNPNGVSIDESTGILTVTDTAAVGSITIRAVSNVNPSVATSFSVTLAESTPDPVPKAPFATNVTLRGLAKPGRTLTGSYSYTDANGDKEAGSAYNWLAGDTATGTFTVIPDSTSKTFTVPTSILGKYIKFEVTPKSGVDPSVGNSESSTAVLVTANSEPIAENVNVSGTLLAGRQLTGTYIYKDPDDDPESGSTYQWLQSDSIDGAYSPIAGATEKSLQLTDDMKGKYIEFEVTPSDQYSTGSAGVSTPAQILGAASSLYYVDPVNGDDNHSGTTVNESFKTIQKARDIVRMINSDMSSDITVYLKNGIYEPGYTLTDEQLYDQNGSVYATRKIKSSTLSFDERDSGTNGFNVNYKAAPGETPIISGGRKISEWTLYDSEKNIYRAPSGGNLDTRQLYVNGVRAVRARSDGGLTNAVQTATGYTTSDTFQAGWKNIQNLEMVYKVNWTSSRCNVNSITSASGKANITMQQPCWYFATNKGGTSVKTPWYYENAYELLDQPGEWYLDSSDGYFYYKPRTGENMDTADVVAPELENLMTIQGSGLDTPVHNMNFSGIRFAYNTWLRPSSNSGLADAQNSHIRETGSGFGDHLGLAAVTLQNAKSVVFEGNDFTHLGSIALKTLEGSQDNLIEGNKFTDISGNAIAIGEPSPDQQHTTDSRKLNRNNDVLNNYIDSIGIDYRSSAAISAGYPIDMEISHNEIGNAPYDGLHIGYGWANSSNSNLKNVKIENNLIHDAMQQLRDGGAIYTLGTTGGSTEQPSIVSGNYILRSQYDPGALYFDEGSNYWNASDNMVEASPKFVHIWTSSIKDIHVDNTFTNTNVFTNAGTNTTVSNTQLFADAIWPSEGLNIIENAGLESSYRTLRPAEPVERLFIKDLNLSDGQSAKVEVEAALTHSGAVVDAAGLNVKYTSDNPAVAKIDDQGIVTAVGPGKATLSAIVNGQPVTVVNAIYVDDAFDKLTVSAARRKFLPGQTFKVDVAGISKYGKEYAVGTTSFASSNPQVASVDTSGNITALQTGTTDIQVTAPSNGVIMSGSMTLTVSNTVADDIIKDTDYWYVSAGTKVVGDGSLTIGTPSGDAIFQGKRYGDELLKFNMRIDEPTGGWHALTFRNQKDNLAYSSAANDDYMFLITPAGIELHRFNKGARTVLYGTFNGQDGIFGRAIPNNYLSYGQMHTVEFGAQNTSNGVRIILNVDGHSVIDIVDTFNGNLMSPGFFGMYSRTGTITFSYPTPPVTTDDAPSGWVNHDVIVNLAAKDSGSSVSGTYYTVDGGAEQSGTAIQLTEEGVHTIAYWSVDNLGNAEVKHTVTVKIDKTQPTLQATADQSSLWPISHKLVTVHTNVYGSDTGSGIDTIVLTSITSSEPDSSHEGDIPDDIQHAVFGTLDTTFDLRAERLGSGSGRIYTITYTATDKAGNKTDSKVTITVPHDESDKTQ